MIPVALLVIAGGLLLALAGGSSTVTIIGATVLGIAGVYAVSLFFYEIGLGEDLDRARGGRGPYDRP